MSLRLCNTCAVEKSLDDFPWENSKHIYRRRRCKVCTKIEQAHRRATNPIYKENARRHSLRRKYNITLEEVRQMLIDQEFQCQICRGTISEQLVDVDHDHADNHVRGLLCHLCNVGLGLFRDNIIFLQGAINYLSEDVA